MEMTTTTSPLAATLKALEALVAAKAAALGLVLKVGYIGNCGHNRNGSFDDRSWKVWVHGLRNLDATYSSNLVSVGGHATDDLPALLAAIEAGAIEKALHFVARFGRPNFDDVYHWDRTVTMTAAEVRTAFEDAIAATPEIGAAVAVRRVQQGMRNAAARAARKATPPEIAAVRNVQRRMARRAARA